MFLREMGLSWGWWRWRQISVQFLWQINPPFFFLLLSSCIKSHKFFFLFWLFVCQHLEQFFWIFIHQEAYVWTLDSEEMIRNCGCIYFVNRELWSFGDETQQFIFLPCSIFQPSIMNNSSADSTCHNQVSYCVWMNGSRFRGSDHQAPSVCDDDTLSLTWGWILGAKIQTEDTDQGDQWSHLSGNNQACQANTTNL